MRTIVGAMVGVLLLAGPAGAEEPEVELLPAAQVHVVVPGDTLGAIAGSVGMSLAALLELNPQITNPDRIFPGDGVTVLELVERPPAPSAGHPVHVVVRGDTLSGIAARYGVALSTLIELNPRPNPDLIHVGEKIQLPK